MVDYQHQRKNMLIKSKMLYLLANRASEINQLSNDTNHVLVKRYERTQLSLDHNSISFIDTKFLCMYDKSPIYLISIE